jgi:hypothetical protein
MDDRPNVQVIFTQAPRKGPGLLTVIVELIAFFLMLAIACLLAGLMGRW